MADGYYIERKTGAGGTYAEIAQAVSASPYNDSAGLVSGNTYYYRIRKSTSGNWSSYSNEASVVYVTGSTYYQNVGGADITPVGSLADTLTFAITAGGAAVSPSGSLKKMTSKLIGAGMVFPAGGLKKKGFVNAGGATLTPVTVLVESFLSVIATGGGLITPTSDLSKKVIKLVGRAVMMPAGSIAKKISKTVGQGVVTPAGAVIKKLSKTVGGGIVTASSLLTSIFTDGGEEPPEEDTGIIKRIQRTWHALKNNGE